MLSIMMLTQHNDAQHNDAQHNDSQRNDAQHSDAQHNDAQHNDAQNNSIMTLNTECYYAEFRICFIFMLIVVAPLDPLSNTALHSTLLSFT